MGAPSVVNRRTHLAGSKLHSQPRQCTVYMVSWINMGRPRVWQSGMRRLESLVGVAFSERARLLERG